MPVVINAVSRAISCLVCTGGVFEEAISIASLLLDANCPVAATVRTAGGFIDNTFQVHWALVLSARCCNG